MQVHPLMAGEPGLDAGMFMGGVVVNDDVESEVLRRLTVELLEESEELVVAMAFVALADDLAGGHIEGREEGSRAVALVVVSHRPCPAFLHGQPGLAAVERLNLAFFVDAEDDGLLGRVQVEPDNVLQLFEEPGSIESLKFLTRCGLRP